MLCFLKLLPIVCGSASIDPAAAFARQLAREWQALLDRMVRHDATLRARLLAAYENEPLLQAGTGFTPEARRVFLGDRVQLRIETPDQGTLVADAPRDVAWLQGDRVGLHIDASRFMSGGDATP